MPRPEGLTGIGGLPLWDTFEAGFFFVAGISTGVVLGFLFPSIWRSFRRKFRKISRFEADFKSELLLNTNVLQPSVASTETDPEDNSTPLIIDQFVHARNLMQLGKQREAAKKYLAILADPQVTKHDTNRAFFELSQAYFVLGLHDRAFDLAYELLSRKPKYEQVFEYLLELSKHFSDETYLEKVVNTWKGNLDNNKRNQIAHFFSQFGENFLNLNNLAKAKKMALQALRFNINSARARILLWQATNQETWDKFQHDASFEWTALFADIMVRLRIQEETQISPQVGSKYLGKLLRMVLEDDPSLETLSKILPEVKLILESDRLVSHKKDLLLDILFYACLSQLPENLFAKIICLLDLLSFNSDKALPKLFTLCQSENLILLELGFRVHECTVCGKSSSDFQWECNQCKSLESMKPKILA